MTFIILCLAFFLPMNISANLHKFQQEVKHWPDFEAVQDMNLIPHICKKTYDDAKNLVHYQETPRIPKIIHQIWLGSPVPKEFNAIIKTWKEKHPEWEYKLWTDSDVKQIQLINQKAYDAATNYGMKSDILRLEILHQFGGVYVDIDQECILPHDIFHHITNFYIGLLSLDLPFKISIANGVMGSKKKHQIICNALQKIHKNTHRIINANEDLETIMNLTGPYLMSGILLKYFYSTQTNCIKEPLVLFPKPFFFPLRCEKRDYKHLKRWKARIEKSNLSPYTYGVQYHTCTWQQN